ncbi:thiol peroxidase [Shewanella sp.]|uniref:thiol peroxidase n=1 Tax=Shewanella sp. TaxID=50422 RepID=UPI003563B4FA
MLRTLLMTVLVALSLNAGAAQRASVTMGGNPVSLSGSLPEIGQPAPGFRVVDSGFNPIALSDFKGKTVLISAVPSLDTGVCALQTKRFNDEVGKFDEKSVVMLTLSTDLPFAQKRFCKTEGVENIQVLSDAVWRNFAKEYGLLIENRGLLARSIFIVDADGVLRYSELVAEVSQHPDYDAALKALVDISSR